MISGDLDLREGTLEVLVEADRLLNSSETLGKKRKDGEGAVTVDIENGTVIFTYINEEVGKTVLKHSIDQELEGHVLMEISWSVKHRKINLFIDNKIVKSEDMNFETNFGDNGVSNGFGLFRNGIMQIF